MYLIGNFTATNRGLRSYIRQHLNIIKMMTKILKSDLQTLPLGLIKHYMWIASNFSIDLVTLQTNTGLSLDEVIDITYILARCMIVYQ